MSGLRVLCIVNEAHAALHRGLAERCADALLTPFELGLELDASALEGCSVCARSLVNTREAAVDLAETTQRGLVPSALRARVLAAASPRQPSRVSLKSDGRMVDPSAALALMHLRPELEEPRLIELDRLATRLVAVAPVCDILLGDLAGKTGFAIHFVSVVREGRVHALAQHGLPAAFASYRDIRREASFCTHAVSADAPLIVEDAAREPFFRGSKMVQRFGIRAYVGAPIRSSRGVALGTVCALDFAPRRVTAGLVERVASCADAISLMLEQPPSAAAFSACLGTEEASLVSMPAAPTGPASGLDVEGTNESPVGSCE